MNLVIFRSNHVFGDIIPKALSGLHLYSAVLNVVQEDVRKFLFLLRQCRE